MRWTEENKRTLRQLFLERRLPIADIALKLGRSTASINTVLTKFGVPRQRWVRRFRMSTRMTPALARVHAHVCGDGYMRKAKERDDYGPLARYKRGRYRWRYGFAYTNFNPRLIQSFIDDVERAFGLRGRYDAKRRTVYVKSKAAWEWLTRMGAGKSREWFIPEAISKASRPVRAAWAQAFFDDEGHFESWGRIRARSVNRNGIEQLAHMLGPIVPCHVTPARGLYKDSSCYLVIPAVHGAKFLRVIGSLKMNHPTLAFAGPSPRNPVPGPLNDGA